jgi:hypothetical protein
MIKTIFELLEKHPNGYDIHVEIESNKTLVGGKLINIEYHEPMKQYRLTYEQDEETKVELGIGINDTITFRFVPKD